MCGQNALRLHVTTKPFLVLSDQRMTVHMMADELPNSGSSLAATKNILKQYARILCAVMLENILERQRVYKPATQPEKQSN